MTDLSHVIQYHINVQVILNGMTIHKTVAQPACFCTGCQDPGTSLSLVTL